MSRKGLAGAAMASVVLAMVAVAALTSSVGTASPALDSSSDCVALFDPCIDEGIVYCAGGQKVLQNLNSECSWSLKECSPGGFSLPTALARASS